MKPIGLLCVALLLWTFSSPALSAEIGVKLLPPESPVRAGANCVIQIQLSNSINAAGKIRIYRSFSAELKTARGVYPVTLRLAESAQAMVEELKAGEIITRPYLMKVPQGLTGAVELSLIENPKVRTALLVDAGAVAPVIDRASTSPASSQPTTDEVVADVKPTISNQQAKVGLSQYFFEHILPYEPMYVLWGPDDPAVKLQFSIKYRLFTFPDGPGEFLNGVHFGYTQTSLWDVQAESSPFKDTSYRPELMYVKDWDLPEGRHFNHLTLQGGLMHESNGRAGPDSRSMNIAYIRPSVRFGSASDWNLQVAPRVWAYIGSLSDNPDIKDYRGFGDLRAILTHGNGLALSANLRMGDDWDHLGTQFDLSYPVNELLPKLNLDVYLHAQYYTGFGESFLEYNRHTDAVRFGISLVR